MNPQQLNQHMQKAVQLHQQGRLDQAEKLYRQAHKAFPTHPEILNLLGSVCSQAGRHSEGIGYFEQALAQQPDHALVLVNLGEAQTRAGLLNEARKSFERALPLAPELPVLNYNLANLLKKLNEDEAALFHYEKAIAKAPNQAEYHYNYANTLRDAGRMRSALTAYERAVELNPKHAEAHNNLGTVLLEWDRFDDALSHYHKSIELKPEFDAAWNNLYQFYESNGDTEAAARALKHLIELDPDNPHLELSLANLMPIIPANAAEIDACLARLEAGLERLGGREFDVEKLAKAGCTPASIMIYYGRDDRALRERFAAVVGTAIAPVQPAISFGDKRRIGFVVTKGHEGVFLKCMAGLIRNLPPRYEVSIVCSKPNGRKIIEPELPGFHYLELNQDLNKAAHQISAHGFDLLHYWEVGTDTSNYYLPFFRPARVQVTSWGWPVTTGVPAIDAYLSCELLEPDNPQANYSEELIQLPRLPMHYPRPPVPEQANRAGFGVPESGHVYFCTQNLRKIQPDMDGLFARILAADPAGYVCLIEDKRPAISQKLLTRVKAGLTEEQASRVIMLPRVPAKEYLALVKAADVILDTTHYTGGANTSYDAFAAGTPVVTLPTAFHRGRYTQAAYRQMGYTDLIARDAEEYAALAVALACDPGARAAASAEIQARCGEVFDDQAAVDMFCAAIDELMDR